jgi:hypothetical protein
MRDPLTLRYSSRSFRRQRLRVLGPLLSGGVIMGEMTQADPHPCFPQFELATVAANVDEEMVNTGPVLLVGFPNQSPIFQAWVVLLDGAGG